MVIFGIQTTFKPLLKQNLRAYWMVAKQRNRMPLMEKYGLWYLKRMRKKQPLKRTDVKAYILDIQERKEINRIEKRAIINVTIAGIISSIISGLAGFYADPLLDEASSFFSKENLWYWAIVMGVTIAATLIEIFFIYFDMMAKTHALTKAAHLELFAGHQGNDDIASSIVRAALELPNKKKSDIDIDPKKESSKLVIFLATVLYKLKISVTNFMLKALVKRMMGRAVSRAWLNFLAVPVCALWNGVVCWLVIREVKIRVLGPSAANEIINKLKTSEEKLSERVQLILLKAVGSCIVRTADLHPNLEYLYRVLDETFDHKHGEAMDDSKLFLEDLTRLENGEQGIVLNMLVYAAILDGKVTIRERILLKKAFEICGETFDYNQITRYLSSFRSGQLIDFNIGN